MSFPQVVSRDEWLVARKELLAEEKAMTRARDALNTKRRELPMVRIEKVYLFEGPEGKASLLDLFDGRRQLIVSHFMFARRRDARRLLLLPRPHRTRLAGGVGGAEGSHR